MAAIMPIIPFIPPPVPHILLTYPPTTYSIAYDIFTNRNEHDAPNGWHSPRAKIYHHLKLALIQAGFIRNQYSDWVHPQTSAFHTYITMVNLERIPPPHKFSSTVRRLRMSRMDHFALMDITARIQLGGAFVTITRGPVPSNLMAPVAAAMVPAPGPIPPGAPFARPVDSRPGGASNRMNFLW